MFLLILLCKTNAWIILIIGNSDVKLKSYHAKGTPIRLTGCQIDQMINNQNTFEICGRDREAYRIPFFLYEKRVGLWYPEWKQVMRMLRGALSAVNSFKKLQAFMLKRTAWHWKSWRRQASRLVWLRLCLWRVLKLTVTRYSMDGRFWRIHYWSRWTRGSRSSSSRGLDAFILLCHHSWHRGNTEATLASGNNASYPYPFANLRSPQWRNLKQRWLTERYTKKDFRSFWKKTQPGVPLVLGRIEDLLELATGWTSP